MKFIKTSLFFLAFVFLSSNLIYGAEIKPIKISKNIAGAPITIGIPFAQGELFSPDNIRLLDKNGKEIPCQTTEVTSWAPVDDSIKWVWVFFFSTGDKTIKLNSGKEFLKLL